MFLGAHVNLISYLLPFVGSFRLTSLTLLYCYDICREIGIFNLQQMQKLSLTIFTLMPVYSILHVLCMFATASFANSSENYLDNPLLTCHESLYFDFLILLWSIAFLNIFLWCGNVIHRWGEYQKIVAMFLKMPC
ncbi:uncharacterized protein J3R85_007540 [Psidium guajava]|nr:uncharacterized protein J3R85_007540 [Psidium guajava]